MYTIKNLHQLVSSYMQKNRLFKACSLFLTLFFSSAPYLLNAEQRESSVLFSLINKRLSHMEDVALYKHERNIKIEDLDREQIVINSALEMATEKGLDSTSIEVFFRTQIEIAKSIQYKYFADWARKPTNIIAPDLQTDIRPSLTQLGNSIIIEIGDLLRDNKEIKPEQRSLFRASLTIAKVDLKDKDALFDSLLLIKTQ